MSESPNLLTTPAAEEPTSTQSGLSGLADKVDKAIDKIDKTDAKVREQSKRLSDTYAITVVGFLVLLVMVAGMLWTYITWAHDSMKQMTEQTQLLQQVKDKVAP